MLLYIGQQTKIRDEGKSLEQLFGKFYLRTRGHLRCIAAPSVVSRNGFFKACFLKRKEEGLPPQKAIFATAHKLIRLIFAMLSQRTHFKVKEIT